MTNANHTLQTSDLHERNLHSCITHN